jgi:hypothetical protein
MCRKTQPSRYQIQDLFPDYLNFNIERQGKCRLRGCNLHRKSPLQALPVSSFPWEGALQAPLVK